MIQLGTIKHVELNQSEAFARDQYSLAISGWEIISRQKPWHGMDIEAITTAVVQHNERPLWPMASVSTWKEVVESLWTLHNRLSLENVLLALENNIASSSSQQSE